MGDPHAHVATEEPVLHERAHVQRQPAHEQDHRNQQRTFPAIRDFQADRLRQAAEGETGDQDADRQQHQQAEDARQVPFNIRRQEQAGEEAENHRRHRLHQFDHRLDLAAHARCHEVSGVDRRGNRQRSGQQHGVERRLQGTEGQGRKAQLGFEIGVGGGRLPDVFRLVVVLVPDLAPQRAPGNFRVRVIERQRLKLATRFDNDAVGPWRQAEDTSPFDDRLDQQRTVGSGMEHAQLARGIQRDKTFAAFFGRNFNDWRSAQLEGANQFQALFAIGVTRHEPLRQATLGVADDQRDAAYQLMAGSHFGVAVFQQLVTTVEVLLAQTEYVGLGAAVDNIEPLLARVDEDRLDRLGHLRQLDALGLAGDLAGHHVLFLAERQHVQLRTGGTGQDQRRISGVQADVFKRPTLLVQRDSRFAIGVHDGRVDGLLAVGVSDLVSVTEHQRLAVGQADRYQGVARLVFGDGRHLRSRRDRQADTTQLGTVLDIEKQGLARIGNPHADLVLLFERDHQGLAGVLHPGRRNSLLGGQFGALEQGHDHIGQEEEDQGDRGQHGQAAHQYIPAGQAILQRTNTALALQLRRIEVNSLGRGSRSHCGVGQIIHAHTLAILYDRKMTVQ
ncbi:hypothetical protein D3C76_702520 [compost metagenome]